MPEKIDGAVRIVVPDMDLIYDKYKEDDEEFFRDWMKTHKATLTQAFMILFAHPRKDDDEQSIKSKVASLGKEGFLSYYTENLNQNAEFPGYHVNWFTYHKLEEMLKLAGFKDIHRSVPQGSQFKEMKGNGFDTRPAWSIHVEAMK